MGFRVLVAGGRHFTDYPALRAAIDTLLANHLPDVELLTAGGRGVPMLAASYATERGLTRTAPVPERPDAVRKIGRVGSGAAFANSFWVKSTTTRICKSEGHNQIQEA